MSRVTHGSNRVDVNLLQYHTYLNGTWKIGTNGLKRHVFEQERSSRTSLRMIPSSSSFSIPLRRRTSEPGSCFWCQGSELMPCRDCGGKGYTRNKNHHRNNPVNIQLIVGSKWTAMERVFGWRHFECKQKMKIAKRTYLLLVATCDDSARVWVHSDILKSRDVWAAGWLQKSELIRLLEGNDDSHVCQTCQGSQHVPCRYCSLEQTPIELN